MPKISEHLDIDSKVEFNKTVTNISYNLMASTSSSKVTVKCADGTSYRAKHVIFTPSLGVLKAHHKTLFTPQLPLDKIRAIENIAMGSAGKFFMEFDRPFWINQNLPFLKFATMWTEAQRTQAVAENRKYLLDVVGIYAVDQFPNVLEVFLAGENIREFEEATEEKVLSDILWMLGIFLPNFKPIPQPKATHKTKWLTHKNFLGGYTYPSMKQQVSGAKISDLADSMLTTDDVPALIFAGEATSEEFWSTANGAVDSGFRAAKEIIDYYNGGSGFSAGTKGTVGLVLLVAVLLKSFLI